MKIVIGEGSCGLAAGAGKVHAKLDELFAASNPTNAVVTITSCIGMCFVEPIVDVYEDNGTLHRLVRVKEEDAATIHDAVTSGDLSKAGLSPFPQRMQASLKNRQESHFVTAVS